MVIWDCVTAILSPQHPLPEICWYASGMTRVPAHKFHVTPKDSILCDYVLLYST